MTLSADAVDAILAPVLAHWRGLGFEITYADLAGRGSGRILSSARAQAAHALDRTGLCTQEDIGRILGRERSTISHLLATHEVPGYLEGPADG